MRKIVTNYYNASNHFSSPVRREPAPYRAPVEKCEKSAEVLPVAVKQNQEPDRDTMLLLGLLAVLFLTGCEDKWLLVALGYILLY